MPGMMRRSKSDVHKAPASDEPILMSHQRLSARSNSTAFARSNSSVAGKLRDRFASLTRGTTEDLRVTMTRDPVLASIQRNADLDEAERLLAVQTKAAQHLGGQTENQEVLKAFDHSTKESEVKHDVALETKEAAQLERPADAAADLMTAKVSGADTAVVHLEGVIGQPTAPAPTVAELPPAPSAAESAKKACTVEKLLDTIPPQTDFSSSPSPSRCGPLARIFLQPCCISKRIILDDAEADAPTTMVAG